MTTSTAIERIHIEDDVVDCSLGEGVALLNLRSGKYFTLGESGAFVWDELKRPSTLPALRAKMRERFQLSEERAANDLQVFIDQLGDAGLVRFDTRHGHD